MQRVSVHLPCWPIASWPLLMCSSEMLQPLREYGVGLGMLQKCSMLGCGAADSQECSHHYFSCSQKTWNLPPTVFKSQLGFRGVLVLIFKTPPCYVQLNFARSLMSLFWVSRFLFKLVTCKEFFETTIPLLQKSLFATSRPLFFLIALFYSSKVTFHLQFKHNLGSVHWWPAINAEKL